MENSQDITVRDREPAKQEPIKEYKQKSFKDLVRLQRPEVTRKAPRIQVSKERAYEEDPDHYQRSERETNEREAVSREPTERGTSRVHLTVEGGKGCQYRSDYKMFCIK